MLVSRREIHGGGGGGGDDDDANYGDDDDRAWTDVAKASAAVPQRFLCSLMYWKVPPEWWHCVSAVAALFFDVRQAPDVVATPVVVKQSPL